jgi:hypothetical protein
VQLEQQLLEYVDNPVKTVKLQIKIKHIERLLFDAKSALNTAAATGEFRREVSEIRGEVEAVKTRQHDLEKCVKERSEQSSNEMSEIRERLAQVESENRERKLENEALKNMVTAQATAQHHIQRTVDAVDNRQRVQNLRLHGISSDRVDEELLEIFPRTLHEMIDIAYATGREAGNHKPVLVRFKTVKACEEAHALVRSQAFKDNFPRIKPAYDASELLRVGNSRIRAAEDELRRTFTDITFQRDCLRVNGVRYPASDFVASHVIINGQPFNVEAAVTANTAYEVNTSVGAYCRGGFVNGVRLKKGPRGRGGWINEGTRHRNETDHGRDHRNAQGKQDGGAQRGSQRGGGRGGGRGGHQHQRLADAIPPVNGTNGGNVVLFSHGSKERGGNGMRDLVMGVSTRVWNYQALFTK